jgi:hypothetical protein
LPPFFETPNFFSVLLLHHPTPFNEASTKTGARRRKRRESRREREGRKGKGAFVIRILLEPLWRKALSL